MRNHMMPKPALVNKEDVETLKNKLRIGDRIRIKVDTCTTEGICTERKIWVIVVRKYPYLAEVRPEKTERHLPVMTVPYKDLSVQKAVKR